MRLQEHNATQGGLMRHHAVGGCNTVLQPGDMCYTWQDRRCLGTVLSVVDNVALLLWSLEPFAPQEGEARCADQE